MNGESLAQLQELLAWIDDLIRAAVARAQSAGRDPTDALRGLVISDEEVAEQLGRPPMQGLWGESPLFPAFDEWPGGKGQGVALVRLAHLFGLSLLDCHILLLALAPELDRRYERLYAFLQDDVSQRRPTVNLLMNLLGGTLEERFMVWERLTPNKPLRLHHLVEVAPDPTAPGAPFLAQPVKLDHRILMHLLGDDTPDPRLRGVVTAGVDDPLVQTSAVPDAIRRALPSAPIVFLQGTKGTGRRDAAAALCAELGLPLVVVDLAALKDRDLPLSLGWALALREAHLTEAALLLYDWKVVLDGDDQPPPELWDAIASYPRPVFLCGSESWECLDTTRNRRMLRATFKMPAYEERLAAWNRALELHPEREKNLRLDELASKFKLTTTQVVRAVNSAADMAASRGEPMNTMDLIGGAQAHSSLRLGKLAKKVAPRYDWADLILPPDRVEQLEEVCSRIRFGHVVNDSWGFDRRVAAAPGVTALFAGESGTGKTLAAEVIARDLGLLLYKIDLSSVVSKYIGETEKNLSAIFEEAHMSNAVLFFDEADALFGKRSEVKDAHDRYANLEVAYLLQQLETYEGVAILATNLRQNLDEAFTRRLSFLVDFPFPEREYRELLWKAHFPEQAPLARDVNLGQLADRFPLAGGNIRNAAIASAYLAAADGGTITMAHLRHAIRREHQKMGRLLDDNN
ncbi:MAG TPA: ATP-binding protein [Candidatus Limnocylindrales bacterium]|nr:ATP-binding protein [Candidatus Limnocylindrales bacterium]